MWCSETTDGEAADLTRLLTTQSPEGDPDAKSETSLPYDGVARKEIVSAAACGKRKCNSGWCPSPPRAPGDQSVRENRRFDGAVE